MAHPTTRAARRAERRRIIARRMTWVRAVQSTLDTVARWDDPADPWYTGTGCWVRFPGRLAKWNPAVCCPFCQLDDPRPARWRWDGRLEGGDLPAAPAGRGGMGG